MTDPLGSEAWKESFENPDIPDEYEELPAKRDLLDDEKSFNLGKATLLAAQLNNGNVPVVGTTITNTYPGDTKAEALGRAYSVRDDIQDAGGDCTVEYIAPRYILGPDVFHEIQITITETASPEE